MAQTLDFETIKAKSNRLQELYSARKADLDAYAAMYLMDWTDKPTDGRLKITISPEARNRALGAKRLMTAAAPVFSIPYDKNDEEGRKRSEQIERFSQAVFYQAGRVRQMPVEYDGMESACVFGELHACVYRTDDMVKAAAGSNPSNLRRLEMIAKQTPVLFDIYDPRTGYPELDDFGLASYARKVKMKSGAVLDRYGKAAVASGLNETKRDEDIELWEYWDWDMHAVWVEGKGAIVCAPHKLDILPIVAYVVDGSRLYEKPEQQRQAMLYTLNKSGLWERQNMLLTLTYSNVMNMGLNPTYKHKAIDDQDFVEIDTSLPGGVVRVRGDLVPLEKNIIDPAVRESLDLSRTLSQESTIYDQALGAPLGSDTPFSTVALLNQAGRLPLVTIQKMTGQAFGKMMEIALHLMKYGSGGKVQGTSGVMQLTAKDIPDGVLIDCKVDISLPQDDRQNAMVASQLIKDRVASRRWCRENMLNIGQSKDMEQEIFNEAMDEFMLSQQMQAEAQRMAMQQQAQMQQQTGPMPQAGPMPAGDLQMQGGGGGMGLPAMPLGEPVAPDGMMPPEGV